VCVDAELDWNDSPVVALVEKRVLCFTSSGNLYSTDESIFDLFFKPVKYVRYANVYLYNNGKDRYLGKSYGSEEEAKNGKDTNRRCVATVKIEWEE